MTEQELQDIEARFAPERMSYSRPQDNFDAATHHLVTMIGEVRRLNLQVGELQKLLKRFADLDCCTGYSLGEKDNPAFWDALDVARDYLTHTENRSHEVPVPMILFCPTCNAQHIDEGEWATRPHRTHECQHCRHQWRLSHTSTVGVKELGPKPTR